MMLKKYSILGTAEDIKPVLKAMRKYHQLEYDPNSPDFYVVVGGDGTILHRDIKERVYEMPVLRVHYRKNSLKTLGFTADVNLTNLDIALKDIIYGHMDKDFFLEEENLLDCLINGRRKDTAINEVGVKPRDVSSAILFKLDAEADGNLESLPSPKCSGLVISKKYGSTAWNLSVGGPINLGVDCIHVNMESSPIKQANYILNPNYKLHLQILCDSWVTVDRSMYKADSGSRVKIEKSDKYISFIRTKHTREGLIDKIRRQTTFSLSGIEKAR